MLFHKHVTVQQSQLKISFLDTCSTSSPPSAVLMQLFCETMLKTNNDTGLRKVGVHCWGFKKSPSTAATSLVGFQHS